MFQFDTNITHNSFQHFPLWETSDKLFLDQCYNSLDNLEFGKFLSDQKCGCNILYFLYQVQASRVLIPPRLQLTDFDQGHVTRSRIASLTAYSLQMSEHILFFSWTLQPPTHDLIKTRPPHITRVTKKNVHKYLRVIKFTCLSSDSIEELHYKTSDNLSRSPIWMPVTLSKT
jgi:hypothetical protein